MRLLLVILLLAHGLIHFVGFAKAFGIARLDTLTQPISKPWGLVWLLACVSLCVAAALRWFGAGWWWGIAFGAIFVSQLLVFAFWSDAKLATLINTVLLMLALVAMGQWRFARMVQRDLRAMSSSAEPGAVVDAAALASLPLPVQRWLRRACVPGRARVQRVQLRQRGRMQTSRGGRWMDFHAKQWVRVGAPAFVWVVDVAVLPGFFLSGHDKYLDGKGAMRIDALALVPVANASGAKTDQASLLRFLGELVWYPSAALQPYIEWQELDESSARATMSYGGISASGVFRFDANGNVVRFEASRYRDEELKDWVITADGDCQEIDGMCLPLRWKVSWREGEDLWTWLELEIVRIQHDG